MEAVDAAPGASASTRSSSFSIRRSTRLDWDPGYIRGYVPGVRENGGQYTHGAIWAAMAFAALRDTERAWELFAMINPINHTRSPHAVATYRAEPYVVAADVYAVAPHTGRGGWSWYTGSAGWMYRLILESLLGFSREGRSTTLRALPCRRTGRRAKSSYRLRRNAVSDHAAPGIHARHRAWRPCRWCHATRPHGSARRRPQGPCRRGGSERGFASAC